VNFLVNSLIKSGYIKARRFKNSKGKIAYVYVLTPKGVTRRVEGLVVHSFGGRPKWAALETKTLLARPEEAKRLGEEGRRFAAENLTLERTAAELAGVYRLVTGVREGERFKGGEHLRRRYGLFLVFAFT
jgi:DNA-binding PadR family transcriptional regulator